MVDSRGSPTEDNAASESFFQVSSRMSRAILTRGSEHMLYCSGTGVFGTIWG